MSRSLLSFAFLQANFTAIVFRLIAAGSSEPDDGLGDGDTAGDIQGFEVGTADTAGGVRAERAGSGTGRRYMFRSEGFDRAGNRAECGTTIVVPHDRSGGS